MGWEGPDHTDPVAAQTALMTTAASRAAEAAAAEARGEVHAGQRKRTSFWHDLCSSRRIFVMRPYSLLSRYSLQSLRFVLNHNLSFFAWRHGDAAHQAHQGELCPPKEEGSRPGDGAGARGARADRAQRDRMTSAPPREP